MTKVKIIGSKLATFGLMSILASTLFAAPTHAQMSRVSPRGDGTSEEAEVQRVMNDYAECIVRQNRTPVEHLLAMPMGSDEAARAVPRVVSEDCPYDSRVRFDSPLFRGSLSEALYRLDFGRPAAGAAAVAPISYYDGDPAALGDEARQWLALHAFADCTVRARPDASRQLIMSDVTSDAERQAFAALTPVLGGCLTEGVELRFTRPVLRGLIAESLYRLSVAAKDTAAQSGAR